MTHHLFLSSFYIRFIPTLQVLLLIRNILHRNLDKLNKLLNSHDQLNSQFILMFSTSEFDLKFNQSNSSFNIGIARIITV